MPKVTVSPPSVIRVRVNEKTSAPIKSTTIFMGATDVQSEIDAIQYETNTAIQLSNNAVTMANVAFDFIEHGGTIGGSLQVNNNTYVAGNVTITGDFIGTVDGGLY